MSTTYYKSGLGDIGGVGNFRPCSRATNGMERTSFSMHSSPMFPSPSLSTTNTSSSLSLASTVTGTLPAHVGIGGVGNRPLDIINIAQRKAEARYSTKTTNSAYTSRRFSMRRSWQRLFKHEPCMEKKRASSYMKGSYFDFEDDDDDCVSRTSSTGSWKSRLSCRDSGEDEGLLAAKPVRWNS